jgi:oligopeptide transport system ATP-binding protein
LGAAGGGTTVTESEILLEAQGLEVHFPGRRHLFARSRPPMVRAVDGIDLAIGRGETLALVGESGCGKSTAGRALLRLVEPTRGRLWFRGREFTNAASDELRRMRRRLQMVFQDPFASLNPRMTIGETLAEPLLVHDLARGRERRERVARQLELVGLPADAARRYPHEFSGGQRQRVAIARAVMMQPDFIVADEPLSSLDVSLQIQILELFEDLQRQLALTYLFISHDLSVVRQIADRVAVMYLGRIVELGSTEVVFQRPLHPYTQALLAAIPVPDPELERRRHYVPLSGELPSPARPPAGCRFHTRCPHAMAHCATLVPRLVEVAPGRHAACHLVTAP